MAASPADADSASATASAPVVAAAPAAIPVAEAATPASQTSTGARDGRVTILSRIDAPAATLAAPLAASDSGSMGDSQSSDSANGGFRAAAPWRGSETPIDLAAALIGPTAASNPEAAASALVGSLGTGQTALRAIDLPAAARLEQTLSAVDPDVRNMQTMVRTVRLFAAANGASEARLTLDPEHLGPVALTVRVDQGAVSAHFRAETPAAQQWIETHQQELRAGLRDQGLEVKEVVVTTDPDGRRERRQDAQPARPRARRQSGADAPRFEVLV